MNRLLPLFVILLFTFVHASSALAQDENEKDSINRLAFMIGDWSVDETLHMMGGAKGKGKMTAKWGPGRKSIILDYETTEGRMKGFAMHELLFWDPKSGKYVLSWVTSFAPGMESLSGEYANNRFQFSAPTDGGEKISSITPTESGFIIASARKKDDKEMPTMTLVFEKAK